MKSLYDLKPRFQAILRPYADAFAARGLTPNAVTLAGLLLAALSGFLVAVFPDAHTPLVLLAVALLVRMALNAIDGMIAREHRQETPGGRLLNEIADVAGDMLMFLPLVLVPDFSPFLVSLVVMLAVLTEVAGLAATSIGVARRYDGPMGKADRAMAIGVVVLLAGVGLLPAVAINVALAVIVGLAFLTIINRVNAALEEHAIAAEKHTSPAAPPKSPV